MELASFRLTPSTPTYGPRWPGKASAVGPFPATSKSTDPDSAPSAWPTRMGRALRQDPRLRHLHAQRQGPRTGGFPESSGDRRSGRDPRPRGPRRQHSIRRSAEQQPRGRRRVCRALLRSIITAAGGAPTATRLSTASADRPSRFASKRRSPLGPGHGNTFQTFLSTLGGRSLSA